MKTILKRILIVTLIVFFFTISYSEDYYFSDSGSSTGSNDLTNKPDTINVYLNSSLSNNTANGQFITMTNGETTSIALGDLCFVDSTGNMLLANASDSSGVPGIYIAAETILADSSGKFLRNGIIRNDSWSWTVGQRVYVDTVATTGNTLTQTAPINSGNQVQAVGVAIKSNIIDFEPSIDVIEVQ